MHQPCTVSSAVSIRGHQTMLINGKHRARERRRLRSLARGSSEPQVITTEGLRGFRRVNRQEKGARPWKRALLRATASWGSPRVANSRGLGEELWGHKQCLPWPPSPHAVWLGQFVEKTTGCGCIWLSHCSRSSLYFLRSYVYSL